MTSTVRISSAGKSRLRRLQVRWRALRGTAPSHSELLDATLAFVERHEDEFLRETAWTPLTAEELDRLRSLQGDHGVWSVADLDDIVYGDSA
jgi:hypothetical protein